MEKEIIARIRRRDGFVLEKPIPKMEMYLNYADIPPLQAYKEIGDVDYSGNITRKFRAIKETIIIDYQEM